MTLDYALDPASPGSEYRLSLGDQALTGTLAVTKGWQDYTSVKAGILNVAKGRAVLSIRPARQPKVGLMNLRSVTLKPTTS